MTLVRWIILFGISTSTWGGAAELTEPLGPLVAPVDVDNAKVSIGRKLFSDPILSADGKISCVSCHDFNRGGADARQFSIGIGGALGSINAPSVFNSGLNFRQFWNGRAATLEEQVNGPISHPKEMGATWDDVVSKLKNDPTYLAAFQKAFSDGVTAGNVRQSLAVFERTLVTVDSRFDLFLKGNKKALSPVEFAGYEKFKAYGCISCHQGANVGGNMYQTMGVMGDYFGDRGTPETEADQGRFAVTKKPADMHTFRVPSLRNIALTAPYFHDGSAPNLERAVEIMAQYQLGLKIPKEDRDSIVQFLGTLTGRKPASIDGGGGK